MRAGWWSALCASFYEAILLMWEAFGQIPTKWSTRFRLNFILFLVHFRRQTFYRRIDLFGCCPTKSLTKQNATAIYQRPALWSIKFWAPFILIELFKISSRKFGCWLGRSVQRQTLLMHFNLQPIIKIKRFRALASVKFALLAVSHSENTQIRFNFSTIKHKSVHCRCSPDLFARHSLHKSRHISKLWYSNWVLILWHCSLRTHYEHDDGRISDVFAFFCVRCYFFFFRKLQYFFITCDLIKSHKTDLYSPKKRLSNRNISRDRKTIYTDRG